MTPSWCWRTSRAISKPACRACRPRCSGAREVGFTVVSISLSLIAVFIPILLMGGIVGRLFREFALTLSLAILVSLAISLTTTPMMCALFLRPTPPRDERRRTLFDRAVGFYRRTLAWALQHGALVMLILAADHRR